MFWGFHHLSWLQFLLTSDQHQSKRQCNYSIHHRSLRRNQCSKFNAGNFVSKSLKIELNYDHLVLQYYDYNYVTASIAEQIRNKTFLIQQFDFMNCQIRRMVLSTIYRCVNYKKKFLTFYFWAKFYQNYRSFLQPGQNCNSWIKINHYEWNDDMEFINVYSIIWII